MKEYNLKKVLCQLNQWCATNNISVQSVYDECHGMSLQELVYYLLGVVKEAVNQVIENTGAFNELEGKFNDLYNFVNNYFDNLDVQDEINNKIDEMVKDGTFAGLLSSYFTMNIDTTIEMLAMDLATNTIVNTNGYYVINDHGGGKFIISDTETTDKLSLTMQNGKYAVYLDDVINLNKLGAKSNDDTYDLSLIFTKSINYVNYYNNTITLGSGVYYTNNIISNKNNYRLIGSSSLYYPDYQNATATIIKAKTNGTLFDLSSNNSNRIIIENIVFDGNSLSNYNLKCNFSIKLVNCNFINSYGYGLSLENLTYPVFIDGGGCYYNFRGMRVVGPGSTYYVVNNFEISRNTYGLDIFSGVGSNFTNIVFQANKSYALKLYKETASTYLSNIMFTNVYFEANGSLDSTDQDYTGNYNIIINGNNNTISSIDLTNAFINTANQSKNFNINNVSGLSLNNCSFSYNNDDIITNSSVKNDKIPLNYGDTANSTPIMLGYKVNNSFKNNLILNNYGVASAYSNVKTFTLKLDDISASSSSQMTFDGTLNGLPVSGKFAILQLYVGKIFNKITSPQPAGENGKLSFHITYGLQSLPTLNLTENENAYLDNTEVTGWRYFNYWRSNSLTAGLADNDVTLGIKVTASSDYTRNDTENSKKIYATITIAEI